MPSEWLPDIVTLNDSGGAWDKYLEVLYAIFKKDFLDSSPAFTGKQMRLKRLPYEKGKEATFWHLISEGAVEADRTINLSRSERLPWPRPVIDAHADAKVRCWKNSRQGGDRILIALDDFSYLVVLADRGTYVLPWTAYPVERDHQRRKLQKEYEAAVAASS